MRRARRAWSRWRTLDPALVDWIVAVALTVDLVIEALFLNRYTDENRLATAIAAVAFAMPVAVRRRRTMAAVLVSAAALLAEEAFGGQVFNLPSESGALVPLLLAYGAGAWLSLGRGLVTLGILAGGLAGTVFIETYVHHIPGAGGVAGMAELVLTFALAPWLFGRFVRERQRRLDAFAALARQAEAERTEREHQAIAAERIQVGSELQDIIAHSISVMVVQAGGARRLLRAEPDRARASILTVEQTGREALAEMRRLLGVLRKDDDPRALTPQPGLDQLDELLAGLAARGLACTMDRGAPTVPLTPGVDLVAYRVVEAVLTDAWDHGARDAHLTMRDRGEGLSIELSGSAALPGLAERLRLVRERVALYGGQLDLPAPDGRGFSARCRLPLDMAVPA